MKNFDGTGKAIALEIVLAKAPSEELAFGGVWDDMMTIRDTRNIERIEQAGASSFIDGAATLPLLSSIIVPAVLWAATKIADSAGGDAADFVVDKVKEKLREILGMEPKFDGGQLSEEDIANIADAVVNKLLAAANKA